MAKKNLEEDAKASNKVKAKDKITEALLRDICPKAVLARFKAAKTPAARADLLFTLSNKEWKELKKTFDAMNDFLGKLEQWFVQEFKNDQRGVTGKVGRVEVKRKDIPKADDWAKIYSYIKKTGSFDLLNKAINRTAVQERWDQKKNVPGIGKFTADVISLTGVKK